MDDCFAGKERQEDWLQVHDIKVTKHIYILSTIYTNHQYHGINATVNEEKPSQSYFHTSRSRARSKARNGASSPQQHNEEGEISARSRLAFKATRQWRF